MTGLASVVLLATVAQGGGIEPWVPMPPVPAAPLTWELVPEEGELEFAALFFARGTLTNVNSQSALLAGQVTGRLFGENGTTTTDDLSKYFEQRFLGFFAYKPQLLQGRVTLRAALEVDFTFGDISNGVQANGGAAFNGDVVNIQTKRLAAEVDLGAGIQLVVGLQAVTDNPRNPTRALPDELVHAGTHLAFWGSDGAGISFYGRWGPLLGRLAWYNLYANLVDEDDDVHLVMLDAETPIAPDVRLGLHAWYLHDGAKGLGTGLGVGPGSKLAQFNGATPLNLGPDRYTANLGWVGIDATYNLWLAGGPIAASGFFMLNAGRFDVEEASNRPANAPAFDDTDADLLGMMADVEIAWRWAQGSGSVISVEGLWASGDENPDDRTISSVITGNGYGFPGALHASHRSLLLFPDFRVVNRQAAAVYDPGNLGYGVLAAFVNAAWDIVPDRLNVKLGMATATAAAKPRGGERFIGIEGNVEMLYRPMPFLWFGAHFATMRLGQFYEGGRARTEPAPPDGRPWTLYGSMTWVAF